MTPKVTQITARRATPLSAWHGYADKSAPVIVSRRAYCEARRGGVVVGVVIVSYTFTCGILLAVVGCDLILVVNDYAGHGSRYTPRH